MNCPKCHGAMETKIYGANISIERCSHCYGIYAEPDVLSNMKKEWMSEFVLDVGHPKVGKKFDAVDDIDCPECEVKMDKVADPIQTHIWMESCPNCERIFLDAGEFTDLKYETLMDKLRGWRKGLRPNS
jgi:Zn-finger nucleic acid-binding protein